MLVVRIFKVFYLTGKLVFYNVLIKLFGAVVIKQIICLFDFSQIICVEILVEYVISVCGQYFKERLAGKITAAQKRLKRAETV